MKSKLNLFSKFLIAVATFSLLTGGIALAVEDVSSQAFAELSSVVGREIKDKAGAKEVCNQEKHFVSCAEIGKKYNLYKADQVKEVDAVLMELKGNIADELKQCVDETCLLGVANKLASKLVAKNPTLATSLDLTSRKIEDKRVVINAAKEAGVNLQECQTLDPDSASVEMLRACAKLAKNSTIQKYIPREQADMADKSVELKTALSSGKYSCGDNTLDGCGKFCMSPIATERGKEPPAVCKQIAKEVFGSEGVKQLANAYDKVGQATEFYDKQFKNLVFETEDGKKLYNPAEIGNYLQGEGQKGNVKAVEKGLDFMIANGFAKPEDKGFVLKMVQQAKEGGGIPDFDKCAKDPESCKSFIPEDRRAEFEATSGIMNVMLTELKKEGINNPNECQNPENGDKCVSASKRALPQLDDLAYKSQEAKMMATDIRQKIQFGEQGQKAKEGAMKKFESGGRINISGQEFSNFGDVQKFCQENGQACLAEGAKQGFVPKEFAVQKFEQSVNIQGDFEQHNAPQQFQGFQPGQFPGQNPQGISPGQGPQGGFPGQGGPASQQGGPASQQGGQYGSPQGQPYQQSSFPVQAQQIKGGFGQGFDKQKALEQFQKFLDDPEKNAPPSFYMPIQQQIPRAEPSPQQPPQPGQFPGQNPQGGFPGQGGPASQQGGQYGNPKVQPYQPQEGQLPDQSSQNNYRRLDQIPKEQGFDQRDQSLTPRIPFRDDGNFICPAVMPRICSPGEQPRFTGARCNPYSCVVGERTSPPQPIEVNQGGGQTNYTWRLSDGTVQSSSILSRTDSEYLSYLRGVGEQCMKITKDKFVWKNGAGDSSASNWQNFGIPDCSGNAVQTIPTCPSGQYMSGGVCVTTSTRDCTSGQWWDSSSQSCKTTSITKCESGKYWDGTACVASSTNCGAGYSWNGSICQTTCASGEYWTGTSCQSSTGTGAAKCTSSQWWDSGSQTCKDSATNYSSDSAKAGCASAGGTWDAVSFYCKMPNANSCTASQFWTGTACAEKVDPAIACSKTGGVWDITTFYCKMPGQTSSCTGGQWWDSSSQTCKSSNTTTTSSGSSCTSSQYWNGTACVAGTSQTCSTGQYVNGACSYGGGGSSTGGTSCTSGQYWNGTSCVTNTTGSNYSSDPATGCSQAGGTWSASSNYCQMPGQMMPSGGYTMPSGSSCTGDQYWNGSSCVSNTTMPSSGSYTAPSGGGGYTMPSSGGGGYVAPSGGSNIMPPPGATLFDAVKDFVSKLFK